MPTRPLLRILAGLANATGGHRVGSERRATASLVRTQLAELRIPLDQRVSPLSGGQRARALALTPAKRQRLLLLLLDEPVAALDPLARRNFLTTLPEDQGWRMIRPGMPPAALALNAWTAWASG